MCKYDNIKALKPSDHFIKEGSNVKFQPSFQPKRVCVCAHAHVHTMKYIHTQCY